MAVVAHQTVLGQRPARHVLSPRDQRVRKQESRLLVRPLVGPLRRPRRVFDLAGGLTLQSRSFGALGSDPRRGPMDRRFFLPPVCLLRFTHRSRPDPALLLSALLPGALFSSATGKRTNQ